MIARANAAAITVPPKTLESVFEELEKLAFTKAELSQVISVSESQIVVLVRENRIPFVKLAGTKLLRFPRKEIIAWLSEQTIHPSASVAEGDS